MPFDQFVGFVSDSAGATPTPTNFDAWVAAGSPVPAPNVFFPVTSVDPEKAADNIDRNDEIIGEIDEQAPIAFRQTNQVTVRGRLYPYVAKRLALIATGATDVVTGGLAPAPQTHTLVPKGYGSPFLPSINIVVVRDDLAEAYIGCQLDALTMDFPLDGEATWEATFLALYRTPLAAGYTPPAESFTGLDRWVYMLRDTQVFLAGTSQAALRGISLTFNNNFREPEFHAKRNVESLLDGSDKYRIWHPAQRKRGRRRTLTGRLMFHDVKTLQERRQDLVTTQTLVMETEAQDLATTPAAKEMFRFSGHKTALTGGGVGNMTRDDDITSDFEFGVYRDLALGKAATLEFVDASSTPLAFS